MSEITVYDLSVIGKELGVPEKEVIPPFPNAKPMMQQDWTDEYVFKLIDYFKENIKPKGGKVSLLGHLEMWVILAISKAIQPECEPYFCVPTHDENNTMANMPIYDTQFGDPAPGYTLEIKTEEKGDYLFVDYRLKEDAPWEDLIANLGPNLVVPALPEGKNLCLAGEGHYPLQWVVMNAYAKIAGSLFSNDHGNPVSHCGFSANPAIKVGDTVTRD